MLLCYMGSQYSEYQIAHMFGVSDSTVFHCITDLLDSLVEDCQSAFIRWPDNHRALSIIAEFRAKRGIDGVIGAIDGSHIPISCPHDQPADYINRKGFHSIILQAVCDASLSFTDVYVGWPGSVHDARVYRNSPIFAALTDKPNSVCPNGSFLLGDAAYPLSSTILTPFKDTGNLTQQQANYNFCHSSTRMAIERAFGLLKGRFRRLKMVNVVCPVKRNRVIVAACILHNICLLSEDQLTEEGAQELEQLIVDGDSHEVNGFEAVERASVDGKEKREQVMQDLYSNRH